MLWVYSFVIVRLFVLYISKDIGSLLAEMAVRSGVVLVSVGYDLCPHGMLCVHIVNDFNLLFMPACWPNSLMCKFSNAIFVSSYPIINAYQNC